VEQHEQWRRVFPHATVTAARGVTRRRKKIQATGGSGAASSALPFHAGDEGHRDLQQQKTHTTVDFTLF